ncbi:MAG: ABC transporter ATP-binding protein [Lewinellaceae bacterium]|nr:ABC transporter ATP-binding protein [Saprospiraceae bacterium]MCB9313832.1 ABC transporter ATP-binding protein [Lewinellaceae bacterium]HRW74675.1 ABC transporter ATP-binding protein [Saprospiraceae bacterium]
MKHLFVLNRLFWKYRWRLLTGIGFVALANYFSVLQPRMVRYALDEVIANMRLYPVLDGFDAQGMLGKALGEQLLFFGGLVLSFALIMGVFMFFMRWTIIVMSRLMEYDIRKEIYDHYQLLTTAFYKRNSTGDLMSRITEDVSKVRMYLGPAILYGINLVSLFILVIQAMIQVSPMLTLFSLLPLPVLSVSIYYVSELINRKSGLIQKQLSFLNTVAQEVYSGIRVVKSYVQEKAMIRYFNDESETFKAKSLDLARVDALFFPFMVLMIGISTVITIYVGGLQVFSGQITTGNIGEFVIYVNMLTWPVTSIGWVASIIQQAEASQQRINEFLATEPELQDGQVPMEVLEGRIECRNMSFTYPDTGIEALKEVSFSLQPGQKMAVVGRTGSGKSTLAELLLRMYDVSSGELELDGRPIREWRLRDLRNQIGYVPQDVFLFSDTVAANIAFGHPEADASAIASFAEAAAVSQDIERLPAAYETLVGERGVTLSGGQKQRISLARALIKRPRLIILDDCLSAVDTDTEKQILQHLDEELRDASVLVITHRITSMMDFDHILVLDQGRVVEQGTHTELLERRGAYAELYELQLMESERESRS